MARKISMEMALEWMREANRRSPKPCPEESFEEVLQGIALPLMRTGLVEDVSASGAGEQTHDEALSDELIAAVERGAERVWADAATNRAKWIEAETRSAREYLARQGIRVGSRVTISGDRQPSAWSAYLGLLATDHGVEAVVRVGVDTLLAVHYSRLSKTGEWDDG